MPKFRYSVFHDALNVLVGTEYQTVFHIFRATCSGWKMWDYDFLFTIAVRFRFQAAVHFNKFQLNNPGYTTAKEMFMHT